MGISSLFKPNVGELERRKDLNGLIKALRHKNRSIRAEAVVALGKIGDERAVESLIRALRDKDRDVQDNATVALGQIGEATVASIDSILKERDTRRALKRMLGEDLSYAEALSFRCTLVKVLQNIGNKRAIESLIRVLDGPHDRALDLATVALAEIGKPAVEPLIRCLGGFKHGGLARSSAAQALGLIKDERAIEPLIEAMKDVEDRQGSSVRDSAFRALANMGEAAVEPLVDVLNDTSPYTVNKYLTEHHFCSTRIRAARALGMIRDKRAVEPLTRIMEDDSEHKDLRFRASEALRLINKGSSS